MTEKQLKGNLLAAQVIYATGFWKKVKNAS
jgi:hypothetical protein